MKNKLSKMDQVRMIVRNVSLNLVERLHMMNSKSFVDLYDDGLQAEEIENENRRTQEVQERRITKLGARNKKILVELQRSMNYNRQGDS